MNGLHEVEKGLFNYELKIDSFLLQHAFTLLVYYLAN